MPPVRRLCCACRVKLRLWERPNFVTELSIDASPRKQLSGTTQKIFESSDATNCFLLEKNMKPTTFIQPEGWKFCCARRSHHSMRTVPKLGRRNPASGLEEKLRQFICVT